MRIARAITRVLSAILIAGALVCPTQLARAADPNAFTLAFPEEFLTLVVRKAIQDAQVKVHGQSRRLPVDDITIAFEPGRKVVFTLRTDIESARELAKTESGTVARALSRFLERASADYYLLFRFQGKLAVVPPATLSSGNEGVHDAAVAIDFDQSDIALELHRGGQRTASAPAPLERLGLWLLDRHLKTIPVAESLEIATQLHWTWRGHWLSAKGHRVVARFLFARFPFVPFTLDAEGLTTDDHALRLAGHRE